MIGVALALALAAPSSVVVERGSLPGAPITVQLDGVPTGTLVAMLLRDVMRVPYVISPEVLADRRATSVNLVMPRGEVPERVVGYLRRSGFTVELDGGTVYVGRANGSFGSAVPSGSPVAGLAGYPAAAPTVAYPQVSLGEPGAPGASLPSPGAAAPKDVPVELLVYVPANRDPEYLAGVVLAVLPGIKLGSHGDVLADAPQQSINSPARPDVLVLAGDVEDLAQARKLLAVLDRPRPLVSVKAVVVQVADASSRGSALSIVASLAGGRVGASSFADQVPGAQFVRLSAGVLKAVLSAVHSDSRFRVVASPNLSVLSGGTASINSGSETPTVGAAVAGNNGPPVQSIVYRDSGVTLAVRPVVRGSTIEMSVHQERSTFVKTTTGVQGSPTLQKVAADASVVLADGESVVLAGLTEDSETTGRDGLLGGLLGSKSHDKSHAELMVILQAQLVPLPAASAGQFIELKQEGKKHDAVDPLAPTDASAPVTG